MRIQQIAVKINNNEKYKGQTLIEIIIALAFTTVILVGLVTVSIQSIKSANFAKNNALATKLAQEGIEWIRSQRDQRAWVDIANLTDNYCLERLDSFPPSRLCSDANCPKSLNGIFTRCINFNLGSCGTVAESKKIQVTVVWSDSAGEHRSSQITCLSNWQKK